MALIYFKQHYKGPDIEWTVYGSYCEDKISSDGDVLCYVHDVTRGHDRHSMYLSEYEQYIIPSEVAEITVEEYDSALAKIRTAEDIWAEGHKILKSLL